MKNNNSKIESRLLDYIHEECLPKNNKVELDCYKNLFDEGIVDSAGLITFISFIEKEFDIIIPDEDLLPEYFTSISVIADYIRLHQKIKMENISTKNKNG